MIWLEPSITTNKLRVVVFFVSLFWTFAPAFASEKSYFTPFHNPYATRFAPKNAFSNTLDSGKNTKNKKLYSIDKHPIHFQVGLQFGAMKYVNIGLNTQLFLKPVRYFSVCGGVDLQSFIFSFYSSSDEHSISTGIVALYYGGHLYAYNKPNKQLAYYLLAKKGIALGIPSTDGKANNHPYLEYGIGATLKQENHDVSVRAEIAYQQYGLSGTAYGSYQSTIDYNLQFSSFLFRVAWVIHNK